MSGTTAAFGWTYPTSTDLVKDGATAIETLADGIDLSLKRHGCVIRRSTNQGILNTTSTAIEMNLEDLDTDGYHVTAGPTSNRITVPAGLEGVYAVTAYCRWDGVSAVTNPIILISKNGNAVTRAQVLGTGNYIPTAVSWVGYLVVGDWVEMRVYHSSGATRNVETVSPASNLDPLSPMLAAFRVGGPA